jgi:hypothetical protein
VRRATDRLTGTGSLIAAPFMLWMLGGAELACGRADLAVASLTFGQDLAASTGQRWYDAQLLTRKLEAQRALDQLPVDWDDSTAEMLRFTAARSLRVGGLLVAMLRLELHRGTADEHHSWQVLNDLLDEFPDHSPSPLRRRAEAMLSSVTVDP